MRKIIFKGLNLEFNINNVAFEICNIKIYWYGIIIVFAIITALIFMKKDDGKYGIKFNDIINIFIYVLPISIISARIYYIVFKLDYYLRNPVKIFEIRDGGLAIYGGIIGGIITIYVYSKIKKMDFIKILDYIVPYLAIGQAIGRWGNFINIEAYGYETNNLFRMGIMENEIYKEVHPTFLYESIGDFIIFLSLYNKKNVQYKGEITFNYLIEYSIIRIIIENIRADSLMFKEIKISIIISIIFFIIGIIGKTRGKVIKKI